MSDEKSTLRRCDEHSVTGSVPAWSCEPVPDLRVVIERSDHIGGRSFVWRVVPLTVATRALGGVWCGGGDHLATGTATSLKSAARVARACARAIAKETP
jgi:hypothetical protein